jgi:hypothetical protein
VKEEKLETVDIEIPIKLKFEEDVNNEEKTLRELITKKVKKEPKQLPYSRKPKQCNVCGAMVQRLEGEISLKILQHTKLINLEISEHMKLHQTDDLSYICHFCNRKVVAKINLLKHLRYAYFH